MVPENVFALNMDYERCALGFVKGRAGGFETGPLMLLRGREAVEALWRVLTGPSF